MASSGEFPLTCLSFAYPADHLPELSRFSRCTGFVKRVDQSATSRGKTKVLCLHLPPELVHHEWRQVTARPLCLLPLHLFLGNPLLPQVFQLGNALPYGRLFQLNPRLHLTLYFFDMFGSKAG